MAALSEQVGMLQLTFKHESHNVPANASPGRCANLHHEKKHLVTFSLPEFTGILISLINK